MGEKAKNHHKDEFGESGICIRIFEQVVLILQL
jgi:hypothetical protein